MGPKPTGKNTPPLAKTQIRTGITRRMKPREACAILQRLSRRVYTNRNQQISSFTNIISGKLDFNRTNWQIGSVFDIGK
jgi:protein-arginine kinase activator protein McsA